MNIDVKQEFICFCCITGDDFYYDFLFKITSDLQKTWKRFESILKCNKISPQQKILWQHGNTSCTLDFDNFELFISSAQKHVKKNRVVQLQCVTPSKKMFLGSENTFTPINSEERKSPVTILSEVKIITLPLAAKILPVTGIPMRIPVQVLWDWNSLPQGKDISMKDAIEIIRKNISLRIPGAETEIIISAYDKKEEFDSLNITGMRTLGEFDSLASQKISSDYFFLITLNKVLIQKFEKQPILSDGTLITNANITKFNSDFWGRVLSFKSIIS